MTTAPPRSSAPVGRVARADLGDEPVLDPEPAALVLGARVVHRDDPRVAEDHAASSGTSSKRSTSTRPRSVSFSDGITESARNARCWNGASSSQPSSRAAAIDRARRGDDLVERRVGEQARRPAAAARRAPRRRRRRRCRRRGSRAAAPRPPSTRRSCRRRRRCARRARRVDASAPRCRPKPRTKPRPTRPVPRCRSTTAIFARSRSGSASASPARTRRLVDERVGDDLARDDPDHARVAAAPTGCGTSPGRTRRCAPCGAPSPAPPPRGISAAGPPRFSTSSGTKRSRSGRTSRSAW